MDIGHSWQHRAKSACAAYKTGRRDYSVSRAVI